MRKAILERHGALFRDKQESLDYVDTLEIQAKAIHGIEVVKLTKNNMQTSMYKTAWYASQESVYDVARTFIREQMVGGWNYADFK